ncbi:hypothetical protein [Nocardia sp. NBC_00403]|uniref:hypothetical protein n=1 Tax=Nocardia sp. NBC_00403 TaxID=2975990 RepID=UPI002E1AF065
MLTPRDSADVPAGYDLYMKAISGYVKLLEFGSAGQRYWYRYIAKVSAGQTKNVSNLFGLSATGEDGSEQTGDTAQDHQ